MPVQQERQRARRARRAVRESHGDRRAARHRGRDAGAATRCGRRHRPVLSPSAPRGRIGSAISSRSGGGGLSSSRLLSFRGGVSRVRRRHASASTRGGVLLTHHAQIVVEVGGYVAPHPSLPLRERTSMSLVHCSGRSASSLLAGCGGSSKTGFPDDRRRPNVRARGLRARQAGGRRQADEGLVRDSRSRTASLWSTTADGPGPHTGVHLIIVRRDLATIVHRHPPIGADGTISDTITFTEARPVPRRRRRVPEHDRAAAELPAVRLAQRRRGVHTRSRCPRSLRRRPSTATASSCTAGRISMRSRRAS